MPCHTKIVSAFHRPIGVFDSGVGGLTVLKALRARLPGHDFIYFADTARVPYGRKPREMVTQFAYQIAQFLLEKDVLAIVIACNTASAAALPELATKTPVPVWGVIDPGRRSGVAGHADRSRGRHRDPGRYRQRRVSAAAIARGLSVWARACPMFVHLVEEGRRIRPRRTAGAPLPQRSPTCGHDDPRLHALSGSQACARRCAGARGGVWFPATK